MHFLVPLNRTNRREWGTELSLRMACSRLWLKSAQRFQNILVRKNTKCTKQVKAKKNKTAFLTRNVCLTFSRAQAAGSNCVYQIYKRSGISVYYCNDSGEIPEVKKRTYTPEHVSEIWYIEGGHNKRTKKTPRNEAKRRNKTLDAGQGSTGDTFQAVIWARHATECRVTGSINKPPMKKMIVMQCTMPCTLYQAWK